MIITITSNTFHQHDSGEVSSSKPLDFVLNFNNKVMSYYSLNSTLVIQGELDYLWTIIERGKNESHGIDTALSRTFTIIKITGSCYEDWKRKEINFEIVINHYEGLGCSETLNQIINQIKYRFDTLHQCDIQFLDRLCGENNK